MKIENMRVGEIYLLDGKQDDCVTGVLITALTPSKQTALAVYRPFDADVSAGDEAPEFVLTMEDISHCLPFPQTRAERRAEIWSAMIQMNQCLTVGTALALQAQVDLAMEAYR